MNGYSAWDERSRLVADAGAVEAALANSSRPTMPRAHIAQDMRWLAQQPVSQVAACIADLVTHAVADGAPTLVDRKMLEAAAQELARRGLGEIAKPITDTAPAGTSTDLAAARAAMLRASSSMAHAAPTGPYRTPGERMLHGR